MNINTDIRQRHLEAFFRYMRDSGIEPEKFSVPEYSGAVVRMAIKAEMLLDGENVDEMKPREVGKLAREINATIRDALEIPPA